jgi:hypothetical protein
MMINELSVKHLVLSQVLLHHALKLAIRARLKECSRVTGELVAELKWARVVGRQ